MVQNLKAMLLIALTAVASIVAWEYSLSSGAIPWLSRQFEGWLRKSQKVLAGQSGAASGNIIATLFVGLVLILVGLYFVANFVPLFGNITNPGGTVGTFITLAEWIIPLLAIVGLIVYGVTHFIGGGSGGGGGAAHRRRSRRK